MPQTIARCNIQHFALSGKSRSTGSIKRNCRLRTLAFDLLNGSTNASRKVQNPARDSLRQPNARSIRTMMTNSTNRVTVHQKLPSFRRKPVKDQALRYILVAINTIKSAQSKRLTTGFMPSPTEINSFCLYYCIMRVECQANSTGRQPPAPACGQTRGLRPEGLGNPALTISHGNPVAYVRGEMWVALPR